MTQLIPNLGPQGQSVLSYQLSPDPITFLPPDSLTGPLALGSDTVTGSANFPSGTFPVFQKLGNHRSNIHYGEQPLVPIDVSSCIPVF